MGKILAREINAAAYVESSCLDQRRAKNVFQESAKTSQMLVEFGLKAMQSLYNIMMGDSDVGKNALMDAYLENRLNVNFRLLGNKCCFA